MFDELVSATQPTRTLQRGDPQTFVEGGGTADTGRLGRDTDPAKDDLQRWFDVWAAGGPVGALLDKRALMIFGVGSEWVTQDDAITAPHPRTGEPVTAAEYLDWLWPERKRDEWFIRTAQTCYWAGFAVWEPVRTQDDSLVPNRRPFHGFEYIHPPTIDAFWDDHGRIREWVQHVKHSQVAETLQTQLDADEIVHVTLNPKGRHPMGLSIVNRAWDEIQTFQSNKESTSEALQRFAYLGGQVKVGREDGPAIDDQELRRVKQRYRRAEGAKWLVTGQDIDMQPFDTGTIGDGVNNIRDRDIQDLATALDVPLEWTNYAGDGLGTGKPAESRLQAFEASGQSEQRRMANHAIDFARKLLAESPFPDDVHIDLRFDDILTDQAAVAEAYRDLRTAYTKNELREKMGDGPVPDEADIDGDEPVRDKESGEEPGGGGGPFGGLRGPDTGNPRRKLDTPEGVPDNAHSISDASECEGTVVEGPRGGLYCVPAGADGGAEDGTDDLSTAAEFSDEPPSEVSVDNVVDETNLTESGLPDGGTKQDINIVEREDGSTVFMKDYEGLVDIIEDGGWSGTVEDDRLNTEMGSAVTRALGGNTTTNWYDAENQVMRSEGVDDIQGGLEDADFDDDALVETTAAGVLTGNSDLHANQFVVDGDGQPHLIDHDHAGKQLEDGKTIRKAFSIKGPMTWSDDREPEDVWERMNEMVEEQDIDGLAADLEAQGMDEHAANLRANAEFVRETDFEELDLF